MLRLPPPALAKWRQTRIELVARYRVFDVRRVELEESSGRPRGDAFTLGCRDWCNVVALTPDDQIVLVWQYRFGTDALSLEIPGGVIDPGEAPEAAARRELAEETGYEADEIELLGSVEANPALQGNRCFTYVARGARLARATAFDPQEDLETVLLPASRIADLLEGGQVTHSLVQGALETFWRKRAGGRAERGAREAIGWSELEELLTQLEDLERRRTLDLARRLRPGLTLEDIANPHDFPELADPDWQHQGGVLVGVQSVLAAMRARRRESEQAPSGRGGV